MRSRRYHAQRSAAGQPIVSLHTTPGSSHAFSRSALRQLADMSGDRIRKPLKVIPTFKHPHQPTVA